MNFFSQIIISISLNQFSPYLSIILMSVFQNKFNMYRIKSNIFTIFPSVQGS